MDSSWNSVSGQDGLDVTLTDAKKKVTYTNRSWSIYNWFFDEDVAFPTFAIQTFTDFPNGSSGTNVTIANAKKKSTYTNRGWDFVNTWLIYENDTFPYLINTFPSTSFLKIYTGSNWIITYIKIYSGSEWISIPIKTYSGSEWL